MRWANKSKDALPPFDKMKWLLTVAWVALHNQLIREVLEAWSLAAFGHVFFEWKSSSLLHFALLFTFHKIFKHVQQPRAKETSLWLPVFENDRRMPSWRWSRAIASVSLVEKNF